MSYHRWVLGHLQVQWWQISQFPYIWRKSTSRVWIMQLIWIEIFCICYLLVMALCSLCNRPLRSPRLCLPQLAARLHPGMAFCLGPVKLFGITDLSQYWFIASSIFHHLVLFVLNQIDMPIHSGMSYLSHQAFSGMNNHTCVLGQSKYTQNLSIQWSIFFYK